MKTLLTGVLFSVRPLYVCDADMFLNRSRESVTYMKSTNIAYTFLISICEQICIEHTKTEDDK